MLRASLDLSGIRRLRDQLGRYARTTPPRLREATQANARTLRDALRQETPKASGDTAKGWRYRTSGLEASVFNENPNAAWLDQGTRPHMIVAVRGRVLRIPLKGGTTIFRPRAQHPGTRPTNYVARTIARVNRTLVRRYGEAAAWRS